MENRVELGLRYCGGCNTQYDRVALVKRLESLLPQAIFVPAQSGVEYPAIILSCGCSSNCVTVTDLAVPPDRLIYLGAWEQLLPVKKQVEVLLEQHTARQTLCPLHLTHEDVLAVLPPRAPMLFLDEVTQLIPNAQLEAHCRLDAALPFFSGQCPHPIHFPNGLTTEVVAQAAQVLLRFSPRYGEVVPLFAGISNANFYQPIRPNQTLRIVVHLLAEKSTHQQVLCQGQIWIGAVLSADMELRLLLPLSP